MKTIAVDIDEVLARHYASLALFYNKYYGMKDWLVALEYSGA
jgi:hypothetical protein